MLFPKAPQGFAKDIAGFANDFPGFTNDATAFRNARAPFPKAFDLFAKAVIVIGKANQPFPKDFNLIAKAPGVLRNVFFVYRGCFLAHIDRAMLRRMYLYMWYRAVLDLSGKPPGRPLSVSRHRGMRSRDG